MAFSFFSGPESWLRKRVGVKPFLPEDSVLTFGSKEAMMRIR